MKNKIKSYIKITDKYWKDGSNNEQIWIGEEITKKGKYYFVDRTHDDLGQELGYIHRYRISWVVGTDKSFWFVEWKYLEPDESSNKDHWRGQYSAVQKLETDLKPIIPRKQKKKVYGNAVIQWVDTTPPSYDIKNTRLVQFHYKKDGCYYFKTPPLDIVGWENKQWRMNADHQVEIKRYGHWYPLHKNNWYAKVVSAEIY